MSDQSNPKKESLASSNEKIQESPSGKSGALSYSVASNPVYYEQGALHVLFAGASQTLPGHALGPKLFDYYLLHYVEKGRVRSVPNCTPTSYPQVIVSSFILGNW